MKIVLCVVAALAAGVTIGLVSTRLEFARDNLPVDITLTAATSKLPAGKLGPKAVVLNSEKHDFGTMDRNGHGTHTFHIRNDGDAPLTLKTGTTTCKCTKFAAAGENVEPGKTTEVTLEWDAKTSDPEFEQSAQLITNDPNRNPIYLSVHGHILDSVRPDRFDVHFSGVSANEAVTATVKIHAYRTPEFTIEKYELLPAEQADWFNISFAPLPDEEVAKEPKAKAGVLLTIELRKGLPIGSIDQTLKITTNQNRESPLTIKILGDVASDISLVGPGRPDQLLIELPAFARKDGCKQTVFLMVKGPHRDETELKIASVEPSQEFSATLGPANRDHPKRVRYPLTIEIPPNATPVSRLAIGSFARVLVSTTHPEVKELAIRVKYVVPEN